MNSVFTRSDRAFRDGVQNRKILSAKEVMMMERVQGRKRTTATRVQVFLVCVLTVAIAGLWVQPAAAGVVFATDDTLIELSQIGPGPLKAVDVSLLSTPITLTGPTNLLIHFEFECQLFTSVLALAGPPLLNNGTGSTSEAATGVAVWVTVDGVPVFPPGHANDFKAIACDRGHIHTANLGPGESERPALKSKSTHGFTWIAQNVGVGAHFVEVRGTLVAYVTGVDGIARVAVLKRVLTVSF